MIIEGLSPLRMVGGQFVSLSWALKSALAKIREDYDYDFINGITGAAFMIQASPDEECKAWWTTGNQALYLDFAARAFGIPMKRIPEGFNYPRDIEGFLADPEGFFSDHIEKPLSESIGAGVPVIAQGCFGGFRAGQWSLIAGAEGDALVGLPAWGDGYELSEDLPWQIIVLGEPGAEPDPKDFVREALAHAVELWEGKAPSDPGWITGKPAWEMIISGLESDPFCEPCGPDSPSCLSWIASYAAGAFLSALHFTDMASEILELSSPHLEEAKERWAEGFEAIKHITSPQAASAMLAMDRKAVAESLSLARDLHGRAVSAIKGFLSP
ncbi:MAG: hypothetical protein ABIM88_07685 [candidate division WOR-3 bacterium]